MNVIHSFIHISFDTLLPGVRYSSHDKAFDYLKDNLNLVEKREFINNLICTNPRLFRRLGLSNDTGLFSYQYTSRIKDLSYSKRTRFEGYFTVDEEANVDSLVIAIKKFLTDKLLSPIEQLALIKERQL